MNIKCSEVTPSGSYSAKNFVSRQTNLYCVLSIDRYSNRILESVYLERKNAEAYRKKSSQKLHIESEAVSDYKGESTLWCSNEWGPGDVLSFLNLYVDYDDAYCACSSNGRPSPVKISDVSNYRED